jgi:hypothetical protein
VPRETQNGAFVTTLYLGLRRFARAHEPVVDGTVERAGGEHGLVRRVPDDFRDVFAVTTIRPYFL